MTLNQYNGYALNSTGLAWISKTGYTMLGFRNHSDLTGTQPDYDQTYQANCRFSEYTDTGSDPYLEIEYVSQAGPTDLLTEGLANPTNVSDRTPEFSAVYDDSATTSSVIHYRIQVATTSSYWGAPLWDSGKTGMATTTEGNRCPDITYAGDELSYDGSVYYWRIKFWDNEDNEGDWSTDIATFRMVDSIIYGSKIESGNYFEYQFMDGEYWLATDKKGTQYIFGQATTSRQDDPNDDNKI
jgi:hypothetical protein